MADNNKLAREGGLIPKSALTKAWLIWETFPQTWSCTSIWRTPSNPGQTSFR